MHHLVPSINAGNSLRVGRSKPLNQSIVPKDFKYSNASQRLRCNKGLFTRRRWCSKYTSHLNALTVLRRWIVRLRLYRVQARSICHSASPSYSILSLAVNSAAWDLRQWRGPQENWRREAAQTTESCHWNSWQAPHEEFHNRQMLANANCSAEPNKQTLATIIIFWPL